MVARRWTLARVSSSSTMDRVAHDAVAPRGEPHSLESGWPSRSRCSSAGRCAPPSDAHYARLTVAGSDYRCPARALRGSRRPARAHGGSRRDRRHTERGAALEVEAAFVERARNAAIGDEAVCKRAALVRPGVVRARLPGRRAEDRDPAIPDGDGPRRAARLSMVQAHMGDDVGAPTAGTAAGFIARPPDVARRVRPAAVRGRPAGRGR